MSVNQIRTYATNRKRFKENKCNRLEVIGDCHIQPAKRRFDEDIDYEKINTACSNEIIKITEPCTIIKVKEHIPSISAYGKFCIII